MDDKDVMLRINDLVDEERALRARAAGQGLTETERERLLLLAEQLDQCWDLLRQRRAKAEFGADPDTARARPAGQVETYLQ